MLSTRFTKQTRCANNGGVSSYLPNSFSTSGCWPGYAYNLFSKMLQICLIVSDEPEVNITLTFCASLLFDVINGAKQFAI